MLLIMQMSHFCECFVSNMKSIESIYLIHFGELWLVITAFSRWDIGKEPVEAGKAGVTNSSRVDLSQSPRQNKYVRQDKLI